MMTFDQYCHNAARRAMESPDAYANSLGSSYDTSDALIGALNDCKNPAIQKALAVIKDNPYDHTMIEKIVNMVFALKDMFLLKKMEDNIASVYSASEGEYNYWEENFAS